MCAKAEERAGSQSALRRACRRRPTTHHEGPRPGKALGLSGPATSFPGVYPSEWPRADEHGCLLHRQARRGQDPSAQPRGTVTRISVKTVGI